MPEIPSVWWYGVPPEELSAVANAIEQFRRLWTSIRPPWPHAFDGTAKDVRAVDYLQYEGIGFPECGIEGATLVCGEVLRRAAGLQWVKSYRGDWLLVADDGIARLVINPLARVEEIEFARVPPDGRFSWFIVRAAVDCFPWARPEAQADLRSLVSELDDGELDDMEARLQKLRMANQKAKLDRRGW